MSQYLLVFWDIYILSVRGVTGLQDTGLSYSLKHSKQVLLTQRNQPLALKTLETMLKETRRTRLLPNLGKFVPKLRRQNPSNVPLVPKTFRRLLEDIDRRACRQSTKYDTSDTHSFFSDWHSLLDAQMLFWQHSGNHVVDTYIHVVETHIDALDTSPYADNTCPMYLSEMFETCPNVIATCANDFGLQDQQPVSIGSTVRVIWKQKKSLGGAKVHIANAVALLLAGQAAGKTITGLSEKVLVPEGWLMVRLHPAEKQPDKQKLPTAAVEAMEHADKERRDELPDAWKDRLPGAANMQTDLHYLYGKVSTKTRIRSYHMYVLIPSTSFDMYQTFSDRDHRYWDISKTCSGMDERCLAVLCRTDPFMRKNRQPCVMITSLLPPLRANIGQSCRQLGWEILQIFRANTL